MHLHVSSKTAIYVPQGAIYKPYKHSSDEPKPQQPEQLLQDSDIGIYGSVA